MACPQPIEIVFKQPQEKRDEEIRKKSIFCKKFVGAE